MIIMIQNIILGYLSTFAITTDRLLSFYQDVTESQKEMS